MRGVRRVQVAIPGPLVRVDGRGRVYVLANRVERALTRLDVGADVSATLDHRHDPDLPTLGKGLRFGHRHPARHRRLWFATVGSLISLDFAGQLGRVVLLHEVVADQVAHPPRGLVSDADLPLDRLGGHSAARTSHHVHDVEPELQRRSRLVEDRPGGGVDVMPAGIAGPGGPRGDLMELALALTLGALGVRTVR